MIKLTHIVKFPVGGDPPAKAKTQTVYINPHQVTHFVSNYQRFGSVVYLTNKKAVSVVEDIEDIRKKLPWN